MTTMELIRRNIYELKGKCGDTWKIVDFVRQTQTGVITVKKMRFDPASGIPSPIRPGDPKYLTRYKFINTKKLLRPVPPALYLRPPSPAEISVGQVVECKLYDRYVVGEVVEVIMGADSVRLLGREGVFVRRDLRLRSKYKRSSGTWVVRE